MPSRSGCLVDTNILLRLSRSVDPNFARIQAAMRQLETERAELFYSLQNIAEFWNVSTRPLTANGFGLSVEEANQNLKAFEAGMSLLPDNASLYPMWRELVLKHKITGVQVHDARLAALMQVHEVSRILTLNGSDFSRYSGITVIDPRTSGE